MIAARVKAVTVTNAAAQKKRQTNLRVELFFTVSRRPSGCLSFRLKGYPMQLSLVVQKSPEILATTRFATNLM